MLEAQRRRKAREAFPPHQQLQDQLQAFPPLQEKVQPQQLQEHLQEQQLQKHMSTAQAKGKAWPESRPTLNSQALVKAQAFPPQEQWAQAKAQAFPPQEQLAPH